VVDAADGFLLLRQGAAEKTIPAEFYTFALPARRSSNLPDSAAGSSPEAPSDDANAAGQGLQLLEIAADDWPRWRQTKLVLDWQTGTEFDPAEDAPWLEVTTPDGEIVATLATAAPPALIWLPPDRWPAGETVRVTTLPMTLPHVFAVRAAGGNPDAPAVFVRRPNGDLARLDGALSEGLPAAVAEYLGSLQAAGPVLTHLPDGRTLELSGRLPAEAAAGQPLDLLLQWRLADGATAWPPELAAFVHLRRAGENVAQADGAPVWFGRPAAVEPSGVITDWRRLPADCPTGETCQIVVGVYNPQTGERLPWLDTAGNALGDEIVLGTVEISPPRPPDQACALAGACE
jgi:hypothetical protein